MKSIRIIALLTVFVITVSGLSYKPASTTQGVSQTESYKTLKEKTHVAGSTKGYKKPGIPVKDI